VVRGQLFPREGDYAASRNQTHRAEYVHAAHVFFDKRLSQGSNPLHEDGLQAIRSELSQLAGGDESMSRVQNLDLSRRWGFDLQDNIGFVFFLWRIDNFCACFAIILIAEFCTLAGFCFNPDLVSVLDEQRHAIGGETDAVLLEGYFSRKPDKKRMLPSAYRHELFLGIKAGFGKRFKTGFPLLRHGWLSLWFVHHRRRP